MVDMINIKAKKMIEYCIRNKINAFTNQNIDDKMGTSFFYTNLQAGNNLFPVTITINRSVYIFIQVKLMTNLVTAINSERFYRTLIALNNYFRFFKLTLSYSGDLIFNANLTFKDEDFDPKVLLDILNEIIKFLNGDFIILEKVIRLSVK